jgi:hypothetical protein
VLPALEQNVSHCLSPFSAVASRDREPRYSLSEEEVIHPDLLGAKLSVYGALPLGEVLVRL